AARPGHFRGVATIVAILLNIVRPDFAFFGQKDAQQAALIKRLVGDLAFDTEVVVLPVVREDSGLAMSSRNEYLNGDERRAGVVLNQALLKAQAAYHDGEHDASHLIEIARSGLEKELLDRVE